MSRETRKITWVLWGGIGLLLTTLALAYLLAQYKFKAIGPALPVYGEVADFALTNQDNQVVKLADLKGKVWVTDIIFTRCPGPCLKMTRQMRELQDALPIQGQTKLVTITTDPDYDTPPVLKAYAQRNGAQPAHWMFLTGSKKEIGHLAVDSLKLAAMEKKPEERESPNDLFIHATVFAIVDGHARLRGVFETTGEGVDARRVQRNILAAIRRLEREQ